MPSYRRTWVPGGTYFFTVTLHDRRSNLLTREIDLLRRVVAQTRRRHPFRIDAWVVLPEHMHCLWTLPPDDADFATAGRSSSPASHGASPATNHVPSRNGGEDNAPSGSSATGNT